MRRPLGCMTATGLLAAVITAVTVVGAAAFSGNAIFSSGELNGTVGQTALGGVRSHAELAQRCSSCHVPAWGGERMGDRCLDCHGDVRAEMEERASLHFGFAHSGNCRDCHTEHQGPEASLTRADMTGFPHDQVGFSLRTHPPAGEGGTFLCTDCHHVSLQSFDATSCRGCHQLLDAAYLSEHESVFGDGCLACHDGVDRYGRDFDHQSADFPLMGKHAALNCESCHAGATTVLALQQTPAACADCHAQEDVHERRLGLACGECHNPGTWQEATFDHALSGFVLTGSHLLADCQGCHADRKWHGIPTECTDCHTQDDPHDGQFKVSCSECHLTTRWSELTFDHAKSRFPLTGAHRPAACAACHSGGKYVGTPRDCVGCHRDDDKHAGELGSDCAACHRATRWDDVTFDHNKSAFPLVGSHQQVACSACHAGGHYRGTPTSCVGCHQADDKHGGQYGTDCAACHRVTQWSDATFDHNRSRFPLTGAHRSTACSQCHGGGTFQGTPRACVNCHAEPGVHAGRFGTSCADCHSTSAWLPAGYNGPHSFPMNHGGAGSSCSTCHPSSLTSFTCTNCHEHSESRMQDKHKEISGFSMGSCLNCHPGGREGDDD